MPYPDLGVYGAHTGMFVGEVHDERDTMAVFTSQMRALAGRVDVILLEYYPQGTSPHLKWAEQIEVDLEAFKKTFGKGPQIAQQVYRLWAMAYYHGIDVRGIEVPTPVGKESGSDYLLWRMSAECNQAFLDGADAYAREKGRQSVSFCMYGGLVHWIKLKKLAPGLRGYRCRDDALQPI